MRRRITGAGPPVWNDFEDHDAAGHGPRSIREAASAYDDARSVCRSPIAGICCCTLLLVKASCTTSTTRTLYTGIAQRNPVARPSLTVTLIDDDCFPEFKLEDFYIVCIDLHFDTLAVSYDNIDDCGWS